MNIPAEQLIGKPVYDQKRHKVGKISRLYSDEYSRRPTWATVRSGFFGKKESFVPLSLVELSKGDKQVVLQTDKAVVIDAPKTESQSEVTPEEQMRLYQYYQEAVVAEKGTTVEDESDTVADLAAVQEADDVQLQKHIVTDHATVTLPLPPEKARAERKPSARESQRELTGNLEMFEGEHEIVLRGEMPVLRTQTAAKGPGDGADQT